MEENHAYNEIIGSSSAPYINSLAAQGALMTNSFAIEHPSEPNYLDIFSGSNQGITSDGVDNPGSLSTPNLGQEMLAKGLTWGAYIEDYPGGYDHDHAPWDLFNNNSTPGVEHDFSTFPTDFTQLPKFSVVTPNLQDDMHDGTIQQGDTWLQNNINAYAQWAKANNSLLIVTWDEDDGSQNNQVATLFVGQMVQPGQYNEQINHFNVLRTIEDMYGLSYVGQSANVSPITDIWTSQQVGAVTHFGVTAPAAATAGTPFNVTVSALDANNNVVTGYRGTVTFTSSDGNPALPADYPFTSGDAGTHTFSVTLNTAGTQSVTVTDTSDPTITGTADVAVSQQAQVVTHFGVSVPSAATAGTPFNVTVSALDANNNVVAGYRGTVTFTSSDGNPALPANYPFTSGDAGTHTFSVTLNTAGTQSVTVTDTSNGSITGTADVAVSQPQQVVTHLGISAPSGVRAGSSFSITVTALDASGNVVPGYRGTVTFTSSDGNPALPGDYQFTGGDAGRHTFSVTLNTVGTQTVTVTDTSDASISGTQAISVSWRGHHGGGGGGGAIGPRLALPTAGPPVTADPTWADAVVADRLLLSARNRQQ
jgi:hypothetical protein